MKKLGLYEWSVILFFVIIPLVAIAIEALVLHSDVPWGTITLKWVVFSGVGLRLGSAGIKQVMQPEFTAKEIFKLQNDESFALVKELGFANICIASIALLSLFIPSFVLPAALSGGCYFGLAGLRHVMKPRASTKQTFAMISDLFICAVLILCVLAYLG